MSIKLFEIGEINCILTITKSYSMVEVPKAITDEFMKERISKTRNYVILLLKNGPNRNIAGVEKIIWEHGRRNFALHLSGHCMPYI